MMSERFNKKLYQKAFPKARSAVKKRDGINFLIAIPGNEVYRLDEKTLATLNEVIELPPFEENVWLE